MTLVVKNPPANAEDIRALGLIPGLGRAPKEGKGYQLQYSGLKNSMACIVHWLQRVRHSLLSNFHFHIYGVHIYSQEKL